MQNEIILLSRSDIESLMPFGEYVDAVAEAFRLHAEGRAVSPAPLHIPAEGGGFHVKSASLPLGRRYAFICPNGYPNYDAATTDQRRRAFIADSNLTVGTKGDPAYYIF